MKPIAEIQSKEIVLLYCHTRKCNGVRNMKVIELSRNWLRLECLTCHREMNISCEDYVQKEGEMDVEYKMEMNFKIGQNLFHPQFNDHGVIVGKTHKIIYVNFNKNGIKKLVYDYVSPENKK